MRKEHAASRGGTRHLSQDFFVELASQNPAQLIELIEQRGLAPHHLTYAAEALSLVPDHALAVRVLLRLLDDPHPVVREGAVLGLGRHLSGDVRNRLEEVRSRDESPGVRAAVEDVLELG